MIWESDVVIGAFQDQFSFIATRITCRVVGSAVLTCCGRQSCQQWGCYNSRWCYRVIFHTIHSGMAVAQSRRLLVDPSACFSIHLCIPECEREEILQNEHKHSVRLRDELFKSWYSNVKGQGRCDPMSTPFLWTWYLRNVLKESLSVSWTWG